MITFSEPAPPHGAAAHHDVPEPDPAHSDRSRVGSGEAPVPDPFEDAEALEELEHRITTLAAHIHAAEHRFLTLLAEFDRRRGWELGGHRSCVEWLSFRTGYDLRTARDRVRAARALSKMPATSRAMSRGELSFSKVRALSRLAEVLEPEQEAEVVEIARSFSTAELEKLVRGWRTLERGDELKVEERRHRSRRLTVVPSEDGMYLVRGKLPAEVGALLMRAVEAASDAFSGGGDGGDDRTPAEGRRPGASGGAGAGRGVRGCGSRRFS
jgi:hypothetical protein